MKALLIFLVKTYQWTLSPFWGGHCKFTPSCSNYAIEAIEHHGSVYGSWLTIKRLISCNPWHNGGYDPVPTKPQCCDHKKT